MACDKVEIDGLGVVILCNRGRRGKRCQQPNCRNDATLQCDYPLSGAKAGKTCDRYVCRSHAKPISKGVDYCVPHALVDATSGDFGPVLAGATLSEALENARLLAGEQIECWRGRASYFEGPLVAPAPRCPLCSRPVVGRARCAFCFGDGL